MADQLIIRGAREHNLKDVSLDLPRDALIVFTGLSGSGKSSLAFDTIFAEGQRRYVESLSAYARQFLGQMDKPDVDFIEGLSPGGLASTRSPPRKNPRSTVGTITEVYDYLRLLYARAGRAALPDVRRADRAADPAADRRPHPVARGGPPLPGARAGRSAAARASTSSCSASSSSRASAAPGSTARPTPSTSRRRSTRSSSTPSRSWSTGSRSRSRPSVASPTRSRPRSGWPAGSWSSTSSTSTPRTRAGR